MPPRSRRRSRYVLLVGFVVVVGFASRKFSGILPPGLSQYPGDALWALMVMVLLGALLPRASTYKIGGLALVISFAVEFAQLAQWPWLVALRSTTLGRLALGSTFHAPDLLAYSVGVGVGVLLELLIKRSPRATRTFFAVPTRR